MMGPWISTFPVFHRHRKLAELLPESCVLILIGIGLGVVLYLSRGSRGEHYQLNTSTFFLIILPPIIIDAGYFMPTRPFCDQLGTIAMYAVIGTLVSSLSLDLLILEDI